MNKEKLFENIYLKTDCDSNTSYRFMFDTIPILKGNVYICGTSGSGKTSLLRELGYNLGIDIPNDKTCVEVVYDITKDLDKTVDLFRMVYLNSVPTMYRLYGELSNGEKLRFEILYKYLTEDIVVVDEFTSMLDRTTAFNLCKSIEKLNDKPFIFASCHKDVIDVLNVQTMIDFDMKDVYYAKDGERLVNDTLIEENYKVMFEGSNIVHFNNHTN